MGNNPFTATSLRQNQSKNKRAGKIYRSYAGKSKSGVSGQYHVYQTGERVFVADKPAPAKGRPAPTRFAQSPFFKPAKPKKKKSTTVKRGGMGGYGY